MKSFRSRKSQRGSKMRLKIELFIDEWEIAAPGSSNSLSLAYQIMNPFSEYPKRLQDYLKNGGAKRDPRILTPDYIMPIECLAIGFTFDDLYGNAAVTLAHKTLSMEAEITELTSICTPKYRIKGKGGIKIGTG